MLARWSVLLVIAFAACGRNSMGLSGRDAAPADDSPDATAPARDAQAGSPPAPDMATSSKPDGKSDLAPIPTDAPALAADACVPLACHDPTCSPPYCGQIGDGCGATLDCEDCAVGWSCRGGRCLLDDCTTITCESPTVFPYCGSIGDGCGGMLDCTCQHSGWTCRGNLCMPEGCAPLASCTDAWGGQYCGGLVGNGCGGALDCNRPCSRAGFTCQGNMCVDGNGRSRPYDSGALDPLPPPPPVLPPPPPPPCPPPPPPPAPNP
jgi:hypothetical protein